MANTFYSYLAFLQPSSNGNLLVLKQNLETFYEKQTVADKPEITLDDNLITLVFNEEYEFHVFFSDEEHVNQEAKELAEEYEFDWNENPFDKEKLKTCIKRFEVWGDDDFDMDYFNDSLFIIDEIEKFTDVIIFHNE